MLRSDSDFHDTGALPLSPAESKSVAVEMIQVTPSTSGIAQRNSGRSDEATFSLFDESVQVRELSLGQWLRSQTSPGPLSNWITFCLMVSGIVLVGGLGLDVPIFKFVLSGGLFGFAGGITNWLAVKLLFDRVPFLYGSGIIPKKFKEIRQAFKDVIMNSFFDVEYLQQYVNERSTKIVQELNLAEKLETELEKPEIDGLIKQKLEEVMRKGDQMSQLLMMASMAMGGTDAVVGSLKPMLAGFGKELVNAFVSKFDPKEIIDVKTVRGEIDQLLTEKLEFLSAVRVKKLVEDVIRNHLGWLIVWGNVFGGLIGLVSQAVGYGV